MLLQRLMMTTDEKDQGTAALNSPGLSACPPAAHDLWVMGLISMKRGEDIMLCFDVQNSQSLLKQKAHIPDQEGLACPLILHPVSSKTGRVQRMALQHLHSLEKSGPHRGSDLHKDAQLFYVKAHGKTSILTSSPVC